MDYEPESERSEDIEYIDEEDEYDEEEDDEEDDDSAAVHELFCERMPPAHATSFCIPLF